MLEPTLNNCVIVFVTPDIQAATHYYREVLGFRIVEHYERDEKFAAMYRDGVEIVMVQARFGAVRSNLAAFGAGFDAYLVPVSLEAVERFHEEIQANGARILQPPVITSYGSLEFIFEDLDGRRIGVGLIKQEDVFFGSGH